ncbi:MAG TPA: esterase-like activity of phytase family protein [Pirellulales bacterium]
MFAVAAFRLRNSRRQLRATIICLLAAFVFALAASPLVAAGLELNYRGKIRLETDSAIDQRGTAFKIVGLSGVAYCGGDDFISVMDNSNRLVKLKVTFNPDGSIKTRSVAGGHTITESRDYEGIAYTGPERNSVFISNEATPPPPPLYEYNLDASGSLLQTVKMPAVFMGQVDNRGLESLTRRADGKEMWTANEEALTGDGPTATATTGTVVRLVRMAVDGNHVTPSQEYAYLVDPIHAGIGKPFCSGLSDLLVLPDGTLLTLERSAMEGLPVFETRIYQVDFAGATDISQGALAEGLLGKNYTPVKKTLLFSTANSEVGNRINENLEGLCLGPKLSEGHWAVLGVVDSGDPLSKNTLVSFELITATPEPPMTMIYGAAGGGALVVILIFAALIRRKRASST